jgi:hypothetical protein
VKLTEHFNLAEFTHSQTAIRKTIPNNPSPHVISNLLRTAEQMEKVRELLGNKPISISSGYRSPKLNAAVGGSPTSAHMQGYAVDFICPAFGSPIEIVRKTAASDLTFDQVIQEGTWVHISFDPQNRKEVLTALFTGSGVRYSKGVG